MRSADHGGLHTGSDMTGQGFMRLGLRQGLRRPCAAFWAALMCSACAAQAPKPAVAVNDFRAEGLEQSSARIITDRLRSELVNSGLFRVIERDEMDNVLREQGFQQSGACDDQNCLVEVGQLLGVDRMIAGSIGKLGTLFTISMRLIDVGSGEIITTVAEDCRCSIEDIVSKSVPSLVQKLSQKLEGGAEPGSRAVAGILRVSSEPQGARLSLDGKVMGSTPFENTHLASGEYALQLELDGYEIKKDRILVDPKAPLKLTYQLDPMRKGGGAKPRRKGQLTRRIAFGAGALLCAGAGVFFGQKASSYYDDYEKLGRLTPAREFDNTWNNVEKYQRLRTAAYIASSVTGVGFAVSIFF